MRLVLFSFVLFMTHTHVVFAQHITPEAVENYKHSNKIHQQHTTTFDSDTVSVRDQKTNKRNSRKYVIAPENGLPARNVQGKKTKANYKNQFN